MLKGRSNNIIAFLLLIQLEDVQSEAKSRAHGHKDKEEKSYVFDCLFDQLDVEWGFLEKFEPVKHF